MNPKVNSAFGFTLLEVMIALLILATSLVVLLENHSASLRIHAITRQMAVVTQLARMKMAEIEIDTELDDGSQSGDFGPDFPGYRWEYDAIEEILSFTIYPALPPMEVAGLRVKLRIFWQDGDAEQVFELESFFTQMGNIAPIGDSITSNGDSVGESGDGGPGGNDSGNPKTGPTGSEGNNDSQ